ncbi:MAG: ThuA domain-containing protein [Opitutaceae bacterium]
MKKKALLFHGGWDGHFPEQIAALYQTSLSEAGFEVTSSDCLDCLNDADALKEFDLIVPGWTMGELTETQEAAICSAVKSGVGLAGAHGGMGDAFRAAADYNFMVGGQFVGHPHVGEYTVRTIQKEHVLTHMLPAEFKYDSEQYYLHVDPAIDVLAATEYTYEGATVTMPVAWTRKWGEGRVFYCSLGHAPDEYVKYPYVWEFIIAGAQWASR